MSDTVIRVEHLSKSYTLRHQTGERYTALRDVLTNGVKNVASGVWRVAGSRSQPATRHRRILGPQRRLLRGETGGTGRHSFGDAQDKYWAQRGRQGDAHFAPKGHPLSARLKILSRITERVNR